VKTALTLTDAKQRKRFFLKKKQKLFCILVYALARPQRYNNKSFLVLFFKKEHLALRS